MTKISEQEMDALALNYLRNFENEYGKEKFNRMEIWGVKATDVRKYIERPHDCKRWPEDFFDLIERAIEKTYKHFIMKDPLVF